MRKYRSSKLVKKRKREFLIKGSLILVVFVSFVFFLTQLCDLSSMNIKKIEITGEVQVREEDLSELILEEISGKYLKLFAKRNILIYPKKSIEKNILETFPRIKILDIDIKLPNNLVVNVVERDPYVLFCKDIVKNREGIVSTSTPFVIDEKEECYFVDDRGYIFDKSPNFSKDVLFKFYLNENKNIKDSLFNVEKFKEIDSFVKFIDGLGLNPYKFATEDGIKYEIYFGENSYLTFDSDQIIREIMDNFQSVLNTDDFTGEKDAWDIDYLDLRFGNKVFYKTR